MEKNDIIKLGEGDVVKKLLFVLIVIMFLTGCSEPVEEHDPIFVKEVEDIAIEEFELPAEVLNIFEMYSIQSFYEVNQTIFIVYLNGESETITALDYNFDILYSIEGLDFVGNIKEAHDNYTMIPVSKDDKYYCIINSYKGEEIISMESGGTMCEPLYLGDGDYLYVNREDSDTNQKIYKVIKVNAERETIIYEFYGSTSVKVFSLEDQSMIFRIRSEDKSSYDYVHISITGEVIHTETTSKYNVIPLSDGYLFENDYSVYRRDFDSNEIWEYQTEPDLSFREENENSIIFYLRLADNNDELVEVFNDGTYHSEIQLPDQKRQLRNFEISEELTLVQYSHWDESEDYPQYYVEMQDVSGNVVWSKVYEENRSIIVKNDLIYMQFESVDNEIDLYIEVVDMNGVTLRTDIVTGQLIHIRDNGNYIVVNNNYNDETDEPIIVDGRNYLKEVNTSNELIWKLNIPNKIHLFEIVTDDLFVVSSYSLCSNNDIICTMNYKTVIINGNGEILQDFTEYGKSYPVYIDNEKIYMHTTTPNQVKVYNQSVDEVESYNIIYESNYGYLAIKDGKLITINIPMESNGLFSRLSYLFY